MAPLALARLTGISFPLALPMDEHVDVLSFDQDTLDRELQLNLVKRIEVAVNLPLHLIQISRGQEQRLDPAAVAIYVGLSQRFDGLVDAEDAVMILFVLNSFSRATDGQCQ